MSRKNICIDDLLYLMTRLRDPIYGCPWDIKQSFETIIPHTVEEVYEVIDAIENKDFCHLKEELGDLLFQVIFYSQIAHEKSLFSFNDVVSLVTQKLILRHPHVFPDGTLESRRSESMNSHNELSIKKNWESLKAIERRNKGEDSALSDIPTSLPALIRAQKIQKRAASKGFDWPSISGVFNKIDEEIQELKKAVAGANQEGIEEELGDVMFTVVNLCRHLGVDAETAMRKSSCKFGHRFQYIEDHLRASDNDISGASAETLKNLWDEAKTKINF
jgi:nucleoside triphosphate diphosphatase|tara:strand:+ start:12664 stop:13488 length:825 start_codon:yes stop_codon:yes gene_type:complete